MSLMRAVRERVVPEGHVAMWFLGQNSFLFKGPAGLVAGVDLYLSDSCAGLRPELDLRRRVPVLVEPEDLDADVFLCTHNHRDHADPETLGRLSHRDGMIFVGPPPCCETFRKFGVSDDRIRMAWPDCDLSLGELRVRGTFAIPTDASDLNHMGFVLSFGEGPRVYITGDTADHELVASAARFEPDVMIAVINSGFNNLSPWQAAVLASRVRPKLAIPCHYDMFADNAVDPGQFRAALAVQAPGVRYRQLAYGAPFVYAREA